MPRRKPPPRTWRERCREAFDEDTNFSDGHVHPVPPTPQKVPLFSGELPDAFASVAYAAGPCPQACTSLGPRAQIVGWPSPGVVKMEIVMPLWYNHIAVYTVIATVGQRFVKVKPTAPPGHSGSGPLCAEVGERAPKRRRGGARGPGEHAE